MGRSQFALMLLVGGTISIKRGDTTTLKQDTITCLGTAFSEEFAAGLKQSNQGFTMDNSRVFIQHYNEGANQGYLVRVSWGDHGLADKSLKSRAIQQGRVATGADDPPCLKEAERTCAATLLQNLIPTASLPDWTSIGKSWNQLKTDMTETSHVDPDCKIDKSKSPPATSKPNKAAVIDCIRKQANAAVSKFNAAADKKVFSEESEFLVDYTIRRSDKTYKLRLKAFEGRAVIFVYLFKGSHNPNVPAIPYAYLDNRTCEEPATMRCANQMLEHFPTLLIAGRVGVKKTWKELMESMESDNGFVCK